MVSEDPDVSRTRVQKTEEELYAPSYTDLASAPNKEGLMVHITGGGSDAAGYYTYSNSQWSGPSGGPSNLPESALSDGTTVANTEIYDWGGYLDAAVDPNNAKRVTADIDTGATDARYLRRVEDSFDTRDATTDPSADPPSGPTTWGFVPGSGSADATGGWFYGDTPPSTESRRSFGCDFTTTTAPDGSTVSSGTWALEKEYRVGSGGGDLRVEARTQPKATYSAYNDATSHTSDESFVGEDDAFIEIRAYDSSLQPLDVRITTQYSRTASHQAFANGRTADLGGDEWVSFGHTAALPAATVYVEVVLQTADTSNTWELRGTTGSGNAALLVDDFHAEYTSGLQPSAVLEHDHDERYLEDAAGSVAPNNLQFDPATQNELDAHTSASDNPHSVTAAQAGALADTAGSVSGSNLTFDPATQTEITDGETVNAGQLDGLDSGQFLRSDQSGKLSTDGTETAIEVEHHQLDGNPLMEYDVGTGAFGNESDYRYPINFRSAGDENAHEVTAQILFGDVQGSGTGIWNHNDRSGDILFKTLRNGSGSGYEGLLDALHITNEQDIRTPNGSVFIQDNEAWHAGNLSNPARQSDLHTRYSDDEARSALDGSSPTFSGVDVTEGTIDNIQFATFSSSPSLEANSLVRQGDTLYYVDSNGAPTALN